MRGHYCGALECTLAEFDADGRMWQMALMGANVITADVCGKMVEAATRSCQPMISVPPEPASAAADSLAMLSTAFTFGSILLAIIALIAGFAWGKIVAAAAKEEAKKAAKECVEEWMAKNGPGIIQGHVELLNDATIGEGNDAIAADQLGQEAG